MEAKTSVSCWTSEPENDRFLLLLLASFAFLATQYYSRVAAEVRGSSLVQAGISLLLSSCDRDLGVPIKFQKGCQASSLVQSWDSAFLSSC